MTWAWKKDSDEICSELYEGDRCVLELGCCDGECMCSGKPPSKEDAKRIIDALNAMELVVPKIEESG